MIEVMNAPRNDIAHKATAVDRSILRRAACLALLCALLLTGNGCSWLRFWSDGDPSVDVDGHSAGPEQIAAAKDAVRAKIELAPQEPYWPFRMGELYAASDSAGIAISHLQSALEIESGYAPAAALLSKLYYEMANYDEAVVLLEGFLAENANAPDALRAALALHLEAPIPGRCAIRGPSSLCGATTSTRRWRRRPAHSRITPRARPTTTTTGSRCCTPAGPSKPEAHSLPH